MVHCLNYTRCCDPNRTFFSCAKGLKHLVKLKTVHHIPYITEIINQLIINLTTHPPMPALVLYQMWQCTSAPPHAYSGAWFSPVTLPHIAMSPSGAYCPNVHEVPSLSVVHLQVYICCVVQGLNYKRGDASSMTAPPTALLQPLRAAGSSWVTFSSHSNLHGYCACGALTLVCMHTHTSCFTSGAWWQGEWCNIYLYTGPVILVGAIAWRVINCWMYVYILHYYKHIRSII